MPDEHAEDTAASGTPQHGEPQHGGSQHSGSQHSGSQHVGSQHDGVPAPRPLAHPEDDMPHAELDGKARADAALRRIAAGSDPGREAFDLANEFTDESVSRLRATIARWFRRT